MKYVKVSHDYNTAAAFNTADYLFGWVSGFWFEFPEDILGDLSDVPIGRHVVVNTRKGLTVGRIVDTANDLDGIERVEGKKEKPTQPVVDIIDPRALKAFHKAYQRKADTKEYKSISERIDALNKKRIDILNRLKEEEQK